MFSTWPSITVREGIISSLLFCRGRWGALISIVTYMTGGDRSTSLPLPDTMDWDLALLLWGSSVSSDSTSPTLTILLRRRDILLLPDRCGIPCSPTGLRWHCRKGSTVIIFVRIESPGSLPILFWHHTHWKARRLGCLVRAWQGWKSRLPTWLVEFVEWVGLQFFLCVFVWSGMVIF